MYVIQVYNTNHLYLHHIFVQLEDIQDIYNGFVHLTNVAIQKTAENYDERTGGE